MVQRAWARGLLGKQARPFGERLWTLRATGLVLRWRPANHGPQAEADHLVLRGPQANNGFCILNA